MELVRGGGCMAAGGGEGGGDMFPSPRFVMPRGLVKAEHKDGTLAWTKQV